MKIGVILGNAMAGDRQEITRREETGSSGSRANQGSGGGQEAARVTAIEKGIGENGLIGEVIETVAEEIEIAIETKTEEMPTEIVIETKIEAKTEIETETEAKTEIAIETKIEAKTVEIEIEIKIEETGTGREIGVDLPEEIANHQVAVTDTNTKRVSEIKGREVKTRTEIISKKR